MNDTEHASVSKFRDRLSRLTEEQIAYFSGWLCADGCILHDRESGCPRIKFTICDLDPLTLFSEWFGNSIWGPFKPSGLGKKQKYEWHIAGEKCRILIDRCRPWLSERYTERAARSSDYKVKAKGRKINAEIVADIKARLASGKHGVGRELAKEYGVTSGLISAIKMGRTWK